MVAFPPPPVTFPATRLNKLKSLLSDFCSLPGGSLPKSVFRFYPENFERIFQLFPEPSLSASIQGVNSNFFPSFVTLKRCVTAPFASPCTGQKPVSIFDCRLDSTRKILLVNRQSKRKYFKFRPYFTGIFYNPVENFASCLWKKLWKTL